MPWIFQNSLTEWGRQQTHMGNIIEGLIVYYELKFNSIVFARTAYITSSVWYAVELSICRDGGTGFEPIYWKKMNGKRLFPQHVRMHANAWTVTLFVYHVNSNPQCVGMNVFLVAGWFLSPPAINRNMTRDDRELLSAMVMNGTHYETFIEWGIMSVDGFRYLNLEPKLRQNNR